MEKKYVVNTVLLPSDNGHRIPTKDNFKSFDSFKESVDYIKSILEEYGIEIDVENEIKEKERVDGRIDGRKNEYHNYTMCLDTGYMISDLLESLINGEVSIETRGHNNIAFQGNNESIKLSIIENIQKRINNSKKTAEDLPNNYFSLSRVYNPLIIGKKIEDIEYYCWDCGENLDLILLDDKTLVLSSRNNFMDLTNDMTFEERYNFKIKLDQINHCPINPSIVNGIKTSIKGDLIFANHFGKVDALYEYEGEKYHSINGLQGRIQLSEQLAQKDVGYGQMGNMSINVFLREDGKEIVLGDEYYTDNKGREKIRKFKNFKNIGDISLSVWRWQCADRKVLDKYDYPIPDLKTDGQDWILAEVVPGEWTIEHYFDTSDCTDGIYSRLYLEEK
jgi:hypothetical protein